MNLNVNCLLGPNILLSTLFSDTLNLCSSVNAIYQVYNHAKQQVKYICFIITVFRKDTGRQKTKLHGNKYSPNLICS
jgi:hypothetical protein